MVFATWGEKKLKHRELLGRPEVLPKQLPSFRVLGPLKKLAFSRLQDLKNSDQKASGRSESFFQRPPGGCRGFLPPLQVGGLEVSCCSTRLRKRPPFVVLTAEESSIGSQTLHAMGPISLLMPH